MEVSFKPRPLHPWDNSPRYPLYWRQGCPRAFPDVMEKRKIYFPCWGSNPAVQLEGIEEYMKIICVYNMYYLPP
jgi:hypothetical protein